MSNPKMPDLNALMKQAQKLQGDVAKVQEELAAMECDGAAGGGLVTAVVNGQFEVVRVKIDKSVVDPNDVGMLEDLVVAAVNQAIGKMRALAQQEMAKLTGGLNIPGLGGLGGLGVP
jgi:DNA-binding YbaB/EbfC family protein